MDHEKRSHPFDAKRDEWQWHKRPNKAVVVVLLLQSILLVCCNRTSRIAKVVVFSQRGDLTKETKKEVDPEIKPVFMIQCKGRRHETFLSEREDNLITSINLIIRMCCFARRVSPSPYSCRCLLLAMISSNFSTCRIKAMGRRQQHEKFVATKETSCCISWVIIIQRNWTIDKPCLQGLLPQFHPIHQLPSLPRLQRQNDIFKSVSVVLVSLPILTSTRGRWSSLNEERTTWSCTASRITRSLERVYSRLQ